jgi:hypothetical protein
MNATPAQIRGEALATQALLISLIGVMQEKRLISRIALKEVFDLALVGLEQAPQVDAIRIARTHVEAIQTRVIR